MTKWVFENRCWKPGRDDDYLDRDFQYCAFTTLFCVAPDFSPLVCGVDPGWPQLQRFLPIIERAVREFGLNKTLYLAVTVFLKRGGFDLMPEPALSWLRDIVVAKKQNQEFWALNGEDTVELLKRLLEEKGKHLSDEHRKMIILIADILVDNGVRGAGSLQQQLLRAA